MAVESRGTPRFKQSTIPDYPAQLAGENLGQVKEKSYCGRMCLLLCL